MMAVSSATGFVSGSADAVGFASGVVSGSVGASLISTL